MKILSQVLKKLSLEPRQRGHGEIRISEGAALDPYFPYLLLVYSMLSFINKLSNVLSVANNCLKIYLLVKHLITSDILFFFGNFHQRKHTYMILPQKQETKKEGGGAMWGLVGERVEAGDPEDSSDLTCALDQSSHFCMM